VKEFRISSKIGTVESGIILTSATLTVAFAAESHGLVMILSIAFANADYLWLADFEVEAWEAAFIILRSYRSSNNAFSGLLDKRTERIPWLCKRSLVECFSVCSFELK